jgi:HPt (histidine-containing phosphotransfer) domain-containing protein
MPSVAFDASVLATATAGDTALARDLLDTFLSSASTQVAALDPLGEASQWRDQLHRLKGTARSVGAVRLADALAAAEQDRIDPETRAYWAGRFADELATLKALQS